MPTPSVSTYAFPQLETPSELERTPTDLVARALAEADAIRERARVEGEAAGRAAGLEQARNEIQAALEALADCGRGVEDTLAATVETLAAQAGELALLTAERIVAGTIAAQPERIVEVVRGALRRLYDRHRVTVLVNPEDLDTLTDAASSLQAQLGGIEHLEVQADRRVVRGGAIARTVHGEVDASVAAQLETARELVRAALAGESPADAAAQADTATGAQRAQDTPELPA